MDNLSVNKISSSPIIPQKIITQKNFSDNTSSDVCFQDDFAFASPVSNGSKGMTSFVADDDYHKVIGLPPKAIKKDEVSPNLKFVMYYKTLNIL